MKIIAIPDPRLRQKSTAIHQPTLKLVKFIHQFGQTLIHSYPPGIGLAAPQVGKNIRLLATFLPPKLGDQNPTDAQMKHARLTTYLNPRITHASKTLILGPNRDKPILEGCLSIPKIKGPVPRHQSIKLVYQIIDPQNPNQLLTQTGSFSGFSARLIQHEVDHLDGILFIDRSLKANLPLYQLKDNELVQIKLPPVS